MGEVFLKLNEKEKAATCFFNIFKFSMDNFLDKEQYRQMHQGMPKFASPINQTFLLIVLYKLIKICHETDINNSSSGTLHYFALHFTLLCFKFSENLDYNYRRALFEGDPFPIHFAYFFEAVNSTFCEVNGGEIVY